MKKIDSLFLISLCLISGFSYSTNMVLENSNDPPLLPKKYFKGNFQFSSKMLFGLKPKYFKNVSREKLSLKEMFTLKKIHPKFRKELRRNNSYLQLHQNETRKFHWGGFLLGLLVPIGFIITLFFKDKNRKIRKKSALVAMLIVLSTGSFVLFFALIGSGF